MCGLRLVRRLLLRRRLVFHHDWVIHELSPVWKAIEKTTLGKNPLPSEIGINFPINNDVLIASASPCQKYTSWDNSLSLYTNPYKQKSLSNISVQISTCQVTIWLPVRDQSDTFSSLFPSLSLSEVCAIYCRGWVLMDLWGQL